MIRAWTVVTGLLLMAGCALPVPPSYGLHEVTYTKNVKTGDCTLTMRGGQEFKGVTGNLNPCGDRFELGIDQLDAFEGQKIGQPLWSQYLDLEAQRRAALRESALEVGRMAGPAAMCAFATAANVALGALCAGGGPPSGDSGVTVVPPTFVPGNARGAPLSSFEKPVGGSDEKGLGGYRRLEDEATWGLPPIPKAKPVHPVKGFGLQKGLRSTYIGHVVGEGDRALMQYEGF